MASRARQHIALPSNGGRRTVTVFVPASCTLYLGAIVVLLLVLTPAAACADDVARKPDVLDFSFFLKRVVNLDFLPYIEPWDGECKEITTYDRTGGNRDSDGGMVKDEHGVITFADLEGPGVLCYMYSASPGGIWNFYFDGETNPRLSLKLSDIYNGNASPFLKPLVGRRQVSGHSLVPLPYAKHLKVTITKGPGKESPGDEGWGLYHHLIYRRFPSHIKVKSFDPNLTAAERSLLSDVVAVASRSGVPPRTVSRETREKTLTGSIGAGQTLEFCQVDGSGIVEELRIRADLTAKPQMLRTVVLRAYWDGSSVPAINCPLGDFFSNGFMHRSYASLAMGLTTENEYYCYFPMPFSSGMRMELVNEDGEPVNEVSTLVKYRAVDKLPAKAGRFYARWRKELTEPYRPDDWLSPKNPSGVPNLTGERNYVILDTKGEGRYVGCCLQVYNQHYVWWGEGDSMIFIDDDTWPPSHHGTGTEEFFNDGWGIAPGYSLLAGCIMSDDRMFFHGEQVVFRHDVADFIPFKKKLRVTLEHGHANDFDNEYATVAYWYQSTPPKAVPLPPAKERCLDRQVYYLNNWREIARVRRLLKEDVEALKKDKLLLIHAFRWMGSIMDEAKTRSVEESVQDEARKAWEHMGTLASTPPEKHADTLIEVLKMLDAITEKGHFGPGTT